MSSQGLDTNFRDLGKFVNSLLVASEQDGRPCVSKEKQTNEISLLKETLGDERFFFVVNLQSFEMGEKHGIQQWLGYPEKQFTLRQYWDNVIHPDRKQMMLLHSMQIYKTLCSGAYPLEFMVQRYSSLVPLKHYKGHYVLTKKTSSVFQYDQKNRLLGYLNEFTIVNDYNGEALNPRMYTSYGQLESEKEKAILSKTIETFLGMKVFSVKELQIIRKLAYDPGLTQAQIAAQMELSIHTVDTYYRRFLQKSRVFFNSNFKTALDAATHLRKEGLL